MSSPRLNREQVKRYLVLSGGSGADTMERRLAHDWIWAMDALAKTECADPQRYCAHDIYGNAVEEQIDCGECPSCLARAAMGGGR